MSKNPLTPIMDTNKFNDTNYNKWLRNLRIVLDFENQGYVLDKSLPTALPEGSSPEERVTFGKWLEDNRKVHSIILALMTNDIQKQYDMLDDVPSIMIHMKEVYAVPDRYIRYDAIKAFFGTKMAEGETSTSKAKSKRAGRRKRKKGKKKTITATASVEGATAASKGKDKGRLEVLNSRRQMMCACIVKERGIGRGSVHNSSPTQVLERSRKLSKDEMILRLGDGKAVAMEAMGSLSLVISDHIRIELKDYYYVPRLDKKVGRLKESRGRRFGRPTNLGVLSEKKNDQEALCWTKRDHQRSIGLGPYRRLWTTKYSGRGGYSYFITFTDDHSRCGYVYLIRYKSEAFGRFKKYRLEVENQTGHKIKALRSDQGREYLSGEFIDYLKENGILS
ncbi:UNVERIFIED_CONTAM: hypothetical protein Slati_0179700 [Sesamum latifolium]|uniref:Integrase catalytic domain-containing protein n=1 Tax=Sesamum latifolium TaxID=2727402 RepID=A0AAW2YBB7_9LAMI